MKQNIRTSRLVMLALASAAFMGAFTPAQARAQAFTDEQKKELQVLFKDYIMNNPTVMMDSVDQFRKAEEEKAKQTAKESVSSYKDFYADKALPMAGNPDGDVTVVEYFDFNCGYCKKAFEDVQAILKEDKNVRFVFQDLPILNPTTSPAMAKLSLAAHKQGKYFEMHTALMNYRGPQSDEAFLEEAKKITGLDVEKLKTDTASPEVEAQLAKMSEMAQKLGISGTPGFVIGGQVFPGYIGTEGLKDAIKTARAAKSPSDAPKAEDAAAPVEAPAQ